MFDKIKNEYKDTLLQSFNDSDWVFFKYIIESVPEIMLAYRNKDGDLQLNKDYIALLALLVVALGPSRELILNMKHAKSLRELYDIVADDAQYATRIGPPSLKLLQLLVSDTWPQLAELFTDDNSTRDLLIKHGDIAEALIPLLRMRGTEGSFKTVLKKYIPYNSFATTETPMSSTIQVNTEKDFYDNKQLYDLLLWMKPAGYFLNVSGRKLPIFANNLKALITNQSINKQWVKNMSRYMDPLPGAAFEAPTIRDTYTIRDKPAYLTFQSESPFKLSVYDNKKRWDGKLYYSTDTINWNEWNGITTLNSVNNKLYLRGTGNTTITGGFKDSRWELNSTDGTDIKIKCIGNIETLLDYKTVALGNHPTMADYCYYSMFRDCTNLTTAPSLPATTLASFCYSGMFYGCTGLTTAPSLPATTLRLSCYEDMFYGCTSLTTAPELPATTLANYCYKNMFRDCKSLTTVPELPATTLAVGCYRYMFDGCTALKVSTTKVGSYQYAWRIPTSGTGTEATNWNTNMLRDTGGTFIGNPTINKTYYVENPPAPIGDPIEDKPAYLTFQSPSSFTLETANNQKNWNGTLYYSTDTINWNEWDGKTILNSVGNKLYLRGKDNTKITGPLFINRWVLTGSNIECIGNIENLLDYETVALGNHPTMADYCYDSLFYGCTSLTTAPELPATTLADSCYHSMFEGCTSLTTAPSLPATTLASRCYGAMFAGCKSLTTAPSLPVTTLADSCYSSMFSGCTGLTTAPELPATTLTPYCYNAMFYGCTSLTTAPELPATTLADYCYRGMFYGCASLTTAPELPATTLADYCYANMFYNCTSLTYVPFLPATTLRRSCYENMFRGCTSLTTAPSLPATTLEYLCYSNMFRDCKSLTTVPELPATTLAEMCYEYMFSGCTAFKVSKTKTGSYQYSWRIPTSGTGTTASFWSTGMLSGTGGTFSKPTINTTYYVENPPVPASLEPQSYHPKELYVEFASKIYEDYKAILQATIEYQYHLGIEPAIIELKSEKTFTNIIPSGDYKTQNISVSLTKPPSHNYITRAIIRSIEVTLTPIKQSDKRKASTKIILNKEFSLNNQ